MRLFGDKRKKKDEFEKMLVDMATGESSQKAKSRGDCPACPKCGYRFPMSNADVADAGGGISSSSCPKCGTVVRL